MVIATGKTASKQVTKKAATKKVASKATKKSATKKSATKKSASKATKASATKASTTKKSATKKSASKATKKSATKKSTKKKSATKKSASKATKKSATKKSAGKAVAKKSTSKAAAKKSTSESAAKKSTSTKSAGVEQRATAAAGRAISWLQRHASLPDLPPGASSAALAAVEAAVGSALPPDLAAWWSLHDGGVPIFEYAGMSCAESMRRRKGLETLRRGGTFDDHELFEQDAPRVAAVKWHTGWIPLAEDGCGNLYLVDTAPGPAGQVGQVLRWEVRGGAFAASSVSLADVLERYAAALRSGKFVFDPQSLTFDGPFLDLLAPV